MGLDVGIVTIEYLDRPHGTAYDFAWYLAENCDVIDEGNAFGFFLHSHLRAAALLYIAHHDLDSVGQKAILDWVESLPYDDSGYITLHFNW